MIVDLELKAGRISMGDNKLFVMAASDPDYFNSSLSRDKGTWERYLVEDYFA